MKEKLALLDTDILISILRRIEPVYTKSVDYLEKYGIFNISCITYYECLRGYKVIGAKAKLKLFKEILKITDIVYLNNEILDKTAEIYAFLKDKGLLKGEFDLLIGASAIINDYKIITNNIDHFLPMQAHFGLKVENWLNQ